MSFVDIGRRNVCGLSNLIELDGTQSAKNKFEELNSNVSFPFKPIPSSIIVKRRQTSLLTISPKIDNSHQNNLDGKIAKQVRGIISIFLGG